MQFPQPSIENQHARPDHRDHESTNRERVLRAEVVRRGTREDVPYRHRPHKRKQKHAHHAATHLIRDQLLQKSVSYRNRTHKRKAESEEEH